MPKRTRKKWPVLTTYDRDHLARVALPLGGIGTGTVSLGGRGDLQDWELMNQPAKGFVPSASRNVCPFFALYAKPAGRKAITRALEGPLPLSLYEGASGSIAPNHGLPRFHDCCFAAAYPFGQVHLKDKDVPLSVTLQAFNPMVPCDVEASELPVAVLRFVLQNRTNRAVTASVCGTLPNFIGNDGSVTVCGWGGNPQTVGSKRNRNAFREGNAVRGLFLSSDGVAPKHQAWGTIALTTTARKTLSHRVAWAESGWGGTLLDFWDDFSADGKLDEREPHGEDTPIASLAVRVRVPAKGRREIPFLLAWHFPNRVTWTPKSKPSEAGVYADEDNIGNHYTTRHPDAWAVAEDVAGRLDDLEDRTLAFVDTFGKTDLPAEVKEAALYNLSTLRSQTCFRTPDGRLYGWEGCCDHRGCCLGSCTHVWNYDQATPFLFGELARTMREVEFAHATDAAGCMSFRVHLPLARAQNHGKAAADGQLGCIVKLFREWQLSGDEAFLRRLWPHARRALAFCWIDGGWDGDQDGVMEGCQHNTMDVEYYGPNPQMQGWYLAALRAAEEMARFLDETDFAETCRALFDKGSAWMDAHLFNGDYYEHEIRPPRSEADVAPALRVGMGGKDVTNPAFQLGKGCLVDQLVGQMLARVCGLGDLHKPKHIRKTLKAIARHNRRTDFFSHFNCMRSYVLGDETALLMASYPGERPANPFPYFTEVMTGFEYTAALGMLYEGMEEEGLRCIQDVRARYEGAKRNPFDEAECGHHYARAMASWGAVLALSGFHFSAVDGCMTFAAKRGRHFWSTGDAWGTCRIRPAKKQTTVALTVHGGTLTLRRLVLTGLGERTFDPPVSFTAGDASTWKIKQ